MTSDKGGVAFTFDLDITCKPSEAYKILKLAQKLKEYEDIEEKITKKFAGCIDIKTILDSFCAFYDMQETNKELAQCTLLTNEEVLKYRQWKDAEEQGLLLRLPTNRVWFICDAKTKYATIMSKTIDDLCIYDIKELLKGNSKRYFMTEKEAEQALAKMKEV